MKVKNNLKKSGRILESLVRLRLPHRRMEYCSRPIAKVPRWWARKLRRREEKARERLQRQMANVKGGMKKKKVTQRELKQLQQRGNLDEVSSGMKTKLPHFRTVYRSLQTSGPLPHELQARRNAKKRKMLDELKREHKALTKEIATLMSTAANSESRKLLKTVEQLTEEKLYWDDALRRSTQQLDLLKARLTESKKEQDGLELRMSKDYAQRVAREPEAVVRPAYMQDVEDRLFKDKRLHQRKSVKEKYLEDLAEIEDLYMELDKEGEEVHHYLRTRELFRDVIGKAQDRLNTGKKIVLDLLQDGHNLMNDLTTRMYDFSSLEQLKDAGGSEISSRREQAVNELTMKTEETKELMDRHRTFRQSQTYKEVREATQEGSKPVEQVKEILKDKYEMYQKALVMMGGITEKEGSIKDYALVSSQLWVPEVKRTISESGFMTSKLPFPLIESKKFEDRGLAARKEMEDKIRQRVELLNKLKKERRKLLPFLEKARECHQQVRHRFYTLYRTWKYFSEPLRNMYALLNKRSTFEADKLGIHHRMTEYNKTHCLDTLEESIPDCLSKLVLAERKAASTFGDGDGRRPIMSRPIDRHRLAWKRSQLMKELMTPRTVRLRGLKDVRIGGFPPLTKSPCPLCSTEDRLSKMAVVEHFRDRIRTVDEIRCELRDTQESRDLKELNHPIWECKQPAARSLIQLLILEDRTRHPERIMDFTKLAQ